MIDARELKESEKVLHHVDEVTGENTVIASDRLVEHCLQTGHPIVLVPIHEGVANTISLYRGINLHRLSSLAEALAEGVHLPPMLYAHTGDPTNVQVSHDEWLLVDGNHRYTLFAALHIPFAPAWLVLQETWKQFAVTGFIEVSAEQLRRTDKTFVR